MESSEHDLLLLPAKIAARWKTEHQQAQLARLSKLAAYMGSKASRPVSEYAERCHEQRTTMLAASCWRLATFSPRS